MESPGMVVKNTFIELGEHETIELSPKTMRRQSSEPILNYIGGCSAKETGNSQETSSEGVLAAANVEASATPSTQQESESMSEVLSSDDEFLYSRPEAMCTGMGRANNMEHGTMPATTAPVAAPGVAWLPDSAFGVHQVGYICPSSDQQQMGSAQSPTYQQMQMQQQQQQQQQQQPSYPPQHPMSFALTMSRSQPATPVAARSLATTPQHHIPMDAGGWQQASSPTWNGSGAGARFQEQGTDDSRRTRFAEKDPREKKDLRLKDSQISKMKDTSITWQEPPWKDVTTVMMRNLPNKYHQSKLLEELIESGFHFKNHFNFFYLPMDHTSAANLGYCFINFLNTEIANAFAFAFGGKRMRRFNSNKTVVVMPASVQGFERNYSYYSSTRVAQATDPQYRPLFAQPSECSVLPPPSPAASPTNSVKTSHSRKSNRSERNRMLSLPGAAMVNCAVASAVGSPKGSVETQGGSPQIWHRGSPSSVGGSPHSEVWVQWPDCSGERNWSEWTVDGQSPQGSPQHQSPGFSGTFVPCEGSDGAWSPGIDCFGGNAGQACPPPPR